jgi:hypothetical protein
MTNFLQWRKMTWALLAWSAAMTAWILIGSIDATRVGVLWATHRQPAAHRQVALVDTARVDLSQCTVIQGDDCHDYTCPLPGAATELPHECRIRAADQHRL